MKRLIKSLVGILVVLLAGTAVQAKLQLVENFEGMSTTASPDGQPCSGVMGGTLDTQSEGTGNIDIVDYDGSRVVTVIGHSSGNNARAFGFNGITNPIDNSETGIAFCRFMLRSTSRAPRTYIGLVSDDTDNPITNTNADNPMSIPAGFSWVDNGSGGLDIFTADGGTILGAGFARAQWYNVWIVANNEADTFDLYLSEATGPAGEATLPSPEDLVAGNIPFGIATADPLTGMIFANPTGTGQAERVWIDEIYWDGDQGLSKPTKARNPIPANEESDVSRDVVLNWTPGPFAASHNVYLGTNFDDVSNADASSPLLVSPAQAANSYDPGRLDFNTTYYWRVDEVNAPPDSTVFKGSIWNFTTELFTYPVENVTATASSNDVERGPEHTVNGSGLDDSGLLHGKDPENNMWLSVLTGPQPTWIEYEFDNVYKLHEMWVWNSNGSLEPALGLGFKDVKIEYSANGTDYTTLGTTHEFARAPGVPDYAHNTTVDMGGVGAKYVRLTANSNWGGILNQYGLSEVRFFYIPVHAREPNPDSGAADVDVDVTLSFRAGREAA
ncbi:MAG: discoidin domain-containing protein, partial [Planctomycetota bacterium]